MTEQEELADELSSADKMSAADRLKTARKKRLVQLKKYQQYERQLDKESQKKSASASGGRKKAATSTKPVQPQRASPRVQFVSNVVLLEAAARNDIEEVRSLLQRGTSPDACNDDGLTALHQCCIDDSEEMTRLLVEYGANVDALDSELWTPLHAAATCAHVHLCRFLVEHDANLLAVNADGNMPYDICEDEVTLDYIESEMAKRGVTQEMIDNLRFSRENLMLRDLQEAAKTGADLECRARQGETPLHIAAANGYIQVTEFLLSHGVSVDSVDSDSWQPIHCATCWGQLPVLEMLLERGARLEAKTRNGDTALDLCEDEELKDRMVEIQREIEHSRLAQSRELSRRRSTNIRSASVRRTSMREKKAMSMKEAREEAQKLLESAAAPVSADDDDDDARSTVMNGSPSTSAVVLKVVPPPADDNDSDIAKQPVKPLRSALRSADTKVTDNDVPSKSDKNKSASPAADRSGRKLGGHAVVDRRDTPLDLSQTGGTTVDGTSSGGGTTLTDLKRQRAQSRNTSDPVTTPPQPLAVKSTPSSVGNGDVSSGDHEPRLRLTSPEFIVVEEKRQRRCCVIV